MDSDHSDAEFSYCCSENHFGKVLFVVNEERCAPRRGGYNVVLGLNERWTHNRILHGIKNGGANFRIKFFDWSI